MNDKNEYNKEGDINSDMCEKLNNKQNKNEKNKRLITKGKCSRFYLYILGSALCKFLSSMILGFKDKDTGLFGFCPVLFSYSSIQFLFTYLGYIIFGILIHFFFNAKKKKLVNKTVEMVIKKNQKLMINPTKTNLQLFLVCFCFTVYLELHKLLYSLGFQSLHFWTFETIFTFWLIKKYFVVDIYKHHKYSIIFIFLSSTIFLLISSLIPSEENGLNAYQEISEKYGNYFYCFSAMIVLVFLTFGYSFSRSYSKILMQNKFVSTHILIIFIGITGLIITSISAIILYYINFEYEKNIVDYFNELKSCDKDYKFYMEIFLIYPIYIFCRFMEINFEFLTIYYLNPIYDLIINNLSFSLIKFVSFIIYNFNDVTNFILSELSEIIGLLGYTVYLEIIELNFCGLSDDIKQSIISKAERESNILNIERIKTLNEVYDNDEDVEEKNSHNYESIEMMEKNK